MYNKFVDNSTFKGAKPMIERFERFSYAISEVSRHWHKIAGDEMEKYGLKGTHSVYLITMSKYPDGLTASELCKLCNRDKADVSRMMSIMEKKGLVTKEGAYQNLYKGVFKLTDEGKKAVKYVSKRASLAVEYAGKDVSDEKREIFYEVLESISVNLKAMTEEGLPE